MSIYRLEYHFAAVQDLIDIYSFIEEYAGHITADRKLAEIETATYRLADLPKMGSIRDDLLPGLRAIPAAEKAVICFTVDDETRTVFILCVSYAGSDWTSRVKERL
ncbi:Plasmid stabilization system protein [Neorhizobium galegae bv. officinalis bv. officinalis str. HAMBI 1141]|uniref:Plasmid stabilization system protein n=1 Tax=Neorhizobium galegae bv. officinalis bv. officinalis str. HAMBI 1141 TaxID=1028801 RepID=A0A068T4D1_NEOGA|nr:type II toxin-antitoxin system RelE/ParE family toxin [Neorhizobium galegae]CDN52871.1 Plasmid stabilization system protein [Neorhizobium galegae bv. officinalis bv. officinalis str. HAMBI 1141]